jgi:hypothetical protein
MDAHRLMGRVFVALTLLAACSSLRANPPQWSQPWTEQSHPDVFYNYYVPGNGGVPAQAYPAPLPAPAVAGWTYYTYQPLMPHEFLYHHRRTYYQYYDQGRGLNRTTVRWYGTPVRSALHHLFPFVDLDTVNNYANPSALAQPTWQE